MPPKSSDLAGLIASLRLLIGYLGEQKQFAWWDTNFLSPVGMQFMAINFPRTALPAAINSVAEAAKRTHDARIGKGGVYHLFRLPAALEEDVHHAILSGANPLTAAMIESQAAALSGLKGLAGESAESGSGPLLIGKMSEFDNPAALARLAFLYHLAFTTRKPCFPYFTND